MEAYLAAQYGRREEILAHSLKLVDLGVGVTSQWLHGGHDAKLEHAASAAFNQHCAQADWDDLVRADTFILTTEEIGAIGPMRGGRMVELGIALALRKRVILVGNLENVFCYLPGIEVYDNWDDLVARLTWEMEREMEREQSVAHA